MSLKQKLEYLKNKNNGKFSEDEIKEIFGENYRDKFLYLDGFSNSYKIVFEEEGKLYIVSILENTEDIFGHVDPFPFNFSSFARLEKPYQEIDDKILKNLLKQLEEHKKTNYAYWRNCKS